MTSLAEDPWQDPPPVRKLNRGEQSKYAPMAAELRTRPGQWRWIANDNSSIVTRIRNGHLGFTPAGAFEAVIRRHDKKHTFRGDIWARYVGEDD